MGAQCCTTKEANRVEAWGDDDSTSELVDISPKKLWSSSKSFFGGDLVTHHNSSNATTHHPVPGRHSLAPCLLTEDGNESFSTMPPPDGGDSVYDDWQSSAPDLNSAECGGRPAVASEKGLNAAACGGGGGGHHERAGVSLTPPSSSCPATSSGSQSSDGRPKLLTPDLCRKETETFDSCHALRAQIAEKERMEQGRDLQCSSGELEEGQRKRRKKKRGGSATRGDEDRQAHSKRTSREGPSSVRRCSKELEKSGSRQRKHGHHRDGKPRSPRDLDLHLDADQDGQQEPDLPPEGSRCESH